MSCRHYYKKLGALGQTKFCLQSRACLAQRGAAKFATLFVKTTLKLVKAEANTATSSMITPVSIRIIFALEKNSIKTIPLIFGREKIPIRIIFALEYSCTKGVRRGHKTPALLAKHCHVKLLYIPKTHATMALWLSEFLPSSPKDLYFQLLLPTNNLI